MTIRSAQFVVSSPTWKKCPADGRPEYAFIGRSNVGKSSLINMLTGIGSLAKTSGRPGKTQLINHFLINSEVGTRRSELGGRNSGRNSELGTRNSETSDLIPPTSELSSDLRIPTSELKEWYLVDLPGYGYARTSKTMREQFSRMIHDYLLYREQLVNTYVLIDSRIEPTRIDLEFIHFLGVNGVPFTIVYTKTDKKSQREVAANIRLMRQALAEEWEELPPMLLTSAVTGYGRDALLGDIERINSGLTN